MLAVPGRGDEADRVAAARHGRRDPLPQRLPGDEQVLADVGEPVGARVVAVAVGVVGDDRDAGVHGVVDRRGERGRADHRDRDAVRLRRDRGVRGADHLGDDGVLRAGPGRLGNAQQRRGVARAPYWVGTKNGLVVTWLTKVNFHGGVDGKFPAAARGRRSAAAASRMHAASSAEAAAVALTRPGAASSSFRRVGPSFMFERLDRFFDLGVDFSHRGLQSHSLLIRNASGTAGLQRS